MAQLKVEPGSYWLSEDGKGGAVAVLRVTNILGEGRKSWVCCDVYLKSGKKMGEGTRFPIHFFDGDDPLGINRQVSTLEEGLVMCQELKIEPFFVNSRIPDWPIVIADSLKSGTTLFSTDQDTIKELILSAASRMGLNVDVEMVEKRR
jgi:hypothetical protein